ncbi:Hypothetical protein ORPV_87 [Orpheovirus IHUMI-LCC2]|uniref:Uncharacterized protein n=1 Tax=Orpheovirus IHUMI-LCC2 TaxID=2023057 RepID=A0A2I2L388_9VIRU|nr:Hypothetical protein ORPV_87 [Orpheovirus IHUMI-LCC2]SNW61991.1 Hypothetical protein ORPV_87 [Orpheovirus IHUMI-LCC2]
MINIKMDDGLWYIVYTVDVSNLSNLVYLRRDIVDLNDTVDIARVDNAFTDYITNHPWRVNNINDITYGVGIHYAYLFAHIIDKMSLLEDNDNIYKYAEIGSEDVEYRHIYGNRYKIYFYVGDLNEEDKDIIISNLDEGELTFVSSDTELSSFSGKVEFLIDIDYPNNIWILDNKYIILQRYDNRDENGNNTLRGPIGIVEVE